MSISLQQRIQSSMDSMVLIESELQKLEALSASIEDQLDQVLVGIDTGTISHAARPVARIDDSFVDLEADSRILNNVDQSNAESVKLGNQSYHHPEISHHHVNSDDEGFNSHEFSSDSDEDTYESPLKNKSHNGTLEGSVTAEKVDSDTVESVIRMTKELDLSSKPEPSFLDSSSPNQEQLDESISSILMNKETIKSEFPQSSFSSSSGDKVTTPPPSTPSEPPAIVPNFSVEKLNFDKLNTVRTVDPETLQSLKQFIEKSDELINSELEIEKYLSTIEEASDSAHENSVVLNNNIYSYNEWANRKSNKLIGDLNEVLDSFSS